MIPAQEVLANCQHQSQHGPRYPVGRCLEIVHEIAYQIPSDNTPTAIRAWTEAAHKHWEPDPTKWPAGAPGFWAGGSSGDGHIAVPAGRGRMWGTDTDDTHIGLFALVSVHQPATQWGLRPLGWTNDLDGQLVYQGAKPMPKSPNFDQIYDSAMKAVEGNKKNPKRAEAARIIAQIAAAFKTPAK